MLVTGNGGGAIDGLAATLMRTFGNGNGNGNGEKPKSKPAPKAVEAESKELTA